MYRNIPTKVSLSLLILSLVLLGSRIYLLKAPKGQNTNLNLHSSNIQAEEKAIAECQKYTDPISLRCLLLLNGLDGLTCLPGVLDQANGVQGNGINLKPFGR